MTLTAIVKTDRLKRKVLSECVPFWASEGFIPSSGRFVERFDLCGNPEKNVPTRCMVQARQVFSLCKAGDLTGDSQFHERAWKGFQFLKQAFLLDEGRRGCRFQMLDSPVEEEGKQDTYAIAFVIFALATVEKSLGESSSRILVENLLRFLDTELADTRWGGYLDGNSIDASLVRLQNPQMHLFEALLAAEDVRKSGEFLPRLERLAHLLQHKLFDPASSVIHERFDENWLLASGREAACYEPGHQFEWFWLIKWYEKLCGKPVPLDDESMFDVALRNGFGALGVVDAATNAGPVPASGYRVWPQCEFLKAVAVHADTSHYEHQAECVLDCLLDRTLSQPFSSGWVDRLTSDGLPNAPFVPASTLYHLMTCVLEVERLNSKFCLRTQRSRQRNE